MSMTIRTLWGQMEDSYPGEHAPELLLAVDEFVLEGNPEFWEKERVRVLADGYEKNFIALQEIEIEVNMDAIKAAFTPSVKGTIKK